MFKLLCLGSLLELLDVLLTSLLLLPDFLISRTVVICEMLPLPYFSKFSLTFVNFFSKVDWLSLVLPNFLDNSGQFLDFKVFSDFKIPLSFPSCMTKLFCDTFTRELFKSCLSAWKNIARLRLLQCSSKVLRFGYKGKNQVLNNSNISFCL